MKKVKTIFVISLLLVVIAVGCLSLSACDVSPTLDRDYSFTLYAKDTKIWDLPLGGLFDENSGMELSKDGVVTINLMLKPTLNEDLDDIINLLSILNININFDLSSVSKIDLAPEADKYAAPIIPWFDMKDMKGSLEKLKQSLKGELVLDYDEEATVKMLESIQETGHLNSDFTIPKTLGLRYVGTYTLKRLKSEVTGEEYLALFIDKYSENGEPFLIVTLSEAKGKTTASFRVEFLKTTFAFIEK